MTPAVTSIPPRADLSTRGARPLSVMLVGTYPPTECGIATYTANLRCALDDAGMYARVIRLLDAADDAGPPRDEVAAIWRRGLSSGLADARDAADSADVLVVQHEFGIYPGPQGEGIIDLVNGCSRPVLTVLHTILADPDARQRRIIDALAARSSTLIVHTDAARMRLLETHDLDPTRVEVIPHGASPNLRGEPLVTYREPLLLTWGLLGPGKGIEHGIEAVALMREAGLDARYLVAGETHPNVRASQGEAYRDALVALAARRGVRDLVDFDDRYRDWDTLHAVVRSASVILVPYDSRDQVTSGVLVEALAAGKPVVSTPFPHALELERTGAVSVVPYESPVEIANAVRRILVDPAVRTRMAAAARAEGQLYAWTTVGRRFRSTLSTVVESARRAPPEPVLKCS